MYLVDILGPKDEMNIQMEAIQNDQCTQICISKWSHSNHGGAKTDRFIRFSVEEPTESVGGVEDSFDTRKKTPREEDLRFIRWGH